MVSTVSSLNSKGKWLTFGGHFYRIIKSESLGRGQKTDTFTELEGQISLPLFPQIDIFFKYTCEIALCGLEVKGSKPLVTSRQHLPTTHKIGPIQVK